MEIVAAVAGDAGVPDAGTRGVVGEAAWSWANVRTHTGFQEEWSGWGRWLPEVGNGGCGAGSAKTKATETTKVRGPASAEQPPQPRAKGLEAGVHALDGGTHAHELGHCECAVEMVVRSR